ncbi:hypothetical protein, partial [Streptomyces sp. NPDC002399]
MIRFETTELSGNAELAAPFHLTLRVHEVFERGVGDTAGVEDEGAGVPDGWRHPSKVMPPSEDVLS